MLRRFAQPFHAFQAFREQIWAEFQSHVEDLLSNSQVRRLDLQLQHFKYTRLRHSMDVAYRCYFFSRLLGWKHSPSVARGALLHDFFFLEQGMHCLSLYRSHPKIALENARGITSLTPLEQDMIEKHMFFVNFAWPSCKESALLILMDQVSFAAEMVSSLFIRRQMVAALPEARYLSNTEAASLFQMGLAPSVPDVNSRESS